MIVVWVVCLILSLVCGVGWIVTREDYDTKNLLLGVGWWVFGFVWVLAFLMSLNINIGTKQLTGYIYSSGTTTGYTTAHIRFSQNAGQDVQPEFCVKADSDPGRAITKYVGSDTKVNVTIPPYFYLANNPFACGTTATTIVEAKR